ncbi:SEFIR domain-containing protein [Pantanalinema rosaneae CENA516]|uniref:SEFIR domain-containing protein n=1 Tax=Pantanalinema rosaneae TaxID=1620701 RepID=UPI003D6F2F08
MSEERKAPTKVFISYSWDSDEHKNRVLSLANTLRDPWGIEAYIDQYVRAKYPYTPEKGWDIWMETMIEWAEFVLIVCTETYKRRFRGDEELGIGRGVTWEGTIIRQTLYNEQLLNTKFIPIVFSPQDLIHVPIVLNGNDKYIIEDQRSLRELGYRLRKEATLIIPEVATGELPVAPEPIFLHSPALEVEPPPVLLNVAETLPKVPFKDLQTCDPGKILFIKNVKDPERWAYSLDRMQQPESRVFELMWRSGSHGVALPKTKDLMILHQGAKVTHVVEFLDDEVRQTDSSFFRWVRAVWIAKDDWSQLPHQQEILGFNPNYSDGNTHSFTSPNFSTFRAAWSSLEDFQKHIFQQLTQPKAFQKRQRAMEVARKRQQLGTSIN